MLPERYLNKIIKAFFVFIFFLCICASCTPKKNDRDNKQLSNLDKDVIDSMFVQLNKYYALNPDTAIVLAAQHEKQLIEWEEWYYLMDLYIFLGELYQYRRVDIPKAMSYFSKALNTKNKIENFKVEYLKSHFFYSNIGNILFNFEYYDDALDVYKQSLHIIQKDTTKDALVVVLNNIGLTYLKMNECDSAYKYFLSAKENINTRIQIFNAQHYYYLSILALKCENEINIPLFFSKGKAYLEDLEKKGSNPQNEYFYKEIFDYYNFNAKLHLCLAKYYALKNENTLAITNFEDALYYAKKELNNLLQAEICFSLSKTYYNNNDKKIAIDNAQLALNLLVNDRKFKDAAMTSEFLSEAYSSIGNTSEARKHNALFKNYLDSALVIENNFELMRKKTELSKTGVLLALEDIRFQQKRMNKSIAIQKNINITLVLFLIIIVVIIALVIIYRNKIPITRRFLAKRSYEIIDTSKKEKEKERMKGKYDVLLVQLEALMVNEKLYLNDGIKLNDLAIALKTNQAYLSQLINKHYSMSYTEYINSFRIKEACLLIQNNTNKSFTIDHLYSKLGYKSKSTFYAAFKKQTGVTPAEYIRAHSKTS